MAGCLNKVLLIGNVGKDPEVRYTQAGKAVANFTLATKESWVGNDGKKQERTEWHRCVAWEKIAEVIGEYVQKGSRVHLEGSIQTREWTNKENVKQYTTEIVVQKVIFLDDKKSGDRREGGGAARQAAPGREESGNRREGATGRREESGGREPAPSERRSAEPEEEDVPF